MLSGIQTTTASHTTLYCIYQYSHCLPISSYCYWGIQWLCGKDTKIESLSNFKGNPDPLYYPNNTDSTKLFPQGSTIVTERFYDWSQNNGDNYQSSSTCPVLNPPLDVTFLNSTFRPPGAHLLMISIACTSCADLFTSCQIHFCSSSHWEWSSIKVLLSIFTKVLVWWSWKRQRGQEDGGESVGVRKYHDQMQALKPFSLTMKTGGDSEP